MLPSGTLGSVFEVVGEAAAETTTQTDEMQAKILIIRFEQVTYSRSF